MRAAQRIWPWAAAVVSGLLATLCFPPYDQDWIAWVCLTPLVSALWFGGSDAWPARKRLLYAPLLGMVFGLTHFYSLFHWLTTVTVVGWLALIPYLALYPAAWSALMGWCLSPVGKLERNGRPSILVSRHNLLAAIAGAMAWSGQEWLRGIVFSGFGWNPLGVALHRQTFLIQSADLAGVALLSFQIVLINIIAVLSVYRLIREVGRTSIRPHYDFNLSIALVVALFTYGIHRIQNAPKPDRMIRVAAVQANIPQSQKWNPAYEQQILQQYRALTKAATAANPDLLVWPEAATPRSFFADRATFQMGNEIAASFDGAFLFGTLDFDMTGDYNAAVLLRAGEGSQIYHKLHLVPFGEFIPFRRTFPLFAWVAGDLVPSDFLPGSEPAILKTNSPRLRIAPLICFEDTVDRVVARFAHSRPDLLVNLTNDGWFLESPASRQHQANALFRTVEFRLPMVRAANTGVTCFIDPCGRTTHRLTDANGSTFTAGTLIGNVGLHAHSSPTLFQRTGNILPIAGCLLTIALLLRKWRRYQSTAGQAVQTEKVQPAPSEIPKKNNRQ